MVPFLSTDILKNPYHTSCKRAIAMWLADNRFSREPRGLRSSEESPERGREVTGPHFLSAQPQRKRVNYCNPPGGLNSNLNGLDVYKTLVFICL